MSAAPSCYGCLGTGTLQGFGVKPDVDCLCQDHLEEKATDAIEIDLALCQRIKYLARELGSSLRSYPPAAPFQRLTLNRALATYRRMQFMWTDEAYYRLVADVRNILGRYANA